MNYKEAYEKLLTVEWKTEKCGQEKCWCLMIQPKEAIKYDEIEEAYVCGSGSITKKLAKYIVNLHNNNIIKPIYPLVEEMPF